MLPWAMSWAGVMCLNAPEGRDCTKGLQRWFHLLHFSHLEGRSHLDLARSPKSCLSLIGGTGRLPGGRDWLPVHCMKMLPGSSHGDKDPVALPQNAQPHLCYTVLGITKVSRRSEGNQLPFSFTHLFENPLLMATPANCITPYSIK